MKKSNNTKLIWIVVLLVVGFLYITNNSKTIFLGSVVDLNENCQSTESLFFDSYVDSFELWKNTTCANVNATCTASGGIYDQACAYCPNGKFITPITCKTTTSTETAACTSLETTFTDSGSNAHAMDCNIINMPVGKYSGDACMCGFENQNISAIPIASINAVSIIISACGGNPTTCGALQGIEYSTITPSVGSVFYVGYRVNTSKVVGPSGVYTDGVCYNYYPIESKLIYSSNYVNETQSPSLMLRYTIEETTCENEILSWFTTENREPTTIEKDGRRIYDLRNLSVSNYHANYAWCNKYGSMLFSGNQTFLDKYWSAYISCTVPSPTVTVMCWKKNATVCTPYSKTILESNISSSYCGNDYMSKTDCNPPAVTTPATTQYAPAASSTFDFKEFFNTYKWYIVGLIVLIVVYTIWEQGPGGFFGKKRRR